MSKSVVLLFVPTIDLKMNEYILIVLGIIFIYRGKLGRVLEYQSGPKVLNVFITGWRLQGALLVQKIFLYGLEQLGLLS